MGGDILDQMHAQPAHRTLLGIQGGVRYGGFKEGIKRCAPVADPYAEIRHIIHADLAESQFKHAPFAGGCSGRSGSALSGIGVIDHIDQQFFHSQFHEAEHVLMPVRKVFTQKIHGRSAALKIGREKNRQLARAFARMGAALAENIRDLMAATASKERMEGELSAARDIQMGILPPPDGAPEICGFSASAFLDPAKEVGGDLYDFFTTRDGRRALVLGDVSGKGVPAALFMSMTVTLVRYALDSGLDPAAAMTRVNAMLEEHNPGNMFVTLFLALYDPRSGELAYANGGHCPPCIVDARSDRPPRLLEHLSGPLVGVMPGLEYELFLDRLNDGETCLLFTDGVTEAMNENKELYGEERLMELMARHRNARPKELLSLIFQELLRYRGEEPQSDDITMLAFCRPDPEPETTTLSVEAHAARPGRPTNPNQTGDTGQ